MVLCSIDQAHWKLPLCWSGEREEKEDAGTQYTRPCANQVLGMQMRNSVLRDFVITLALSCQPGFILRMPRRESERDKAFQLLAKTQDLETFLWASHMTWILRWALLLNITTDH